jgi:hypothetical protein
LLYHDLTGIRMSGNKNHGDPTFGDNLGRREAVDHRHIEVDEGNIDVVVVTLVDQLLAIANRTHNFVAETFEQPYKRLTNVGLVLGNGDSYGR